MSKTVLMAILLFVSCNATANIIVDKTGVDEKDYIYDLHQCTEISTQVDKKDSTSSAVGTAAKGAAIGSAGKAIAGGSGTDGAKQGAAIGLGVGILSNSRNRRRDADNFEQDKQNVVKNCMINRGYVVLN
ncbi:glycine zipper family protein [Shewanella abyssi]|uniref:glycine zipper family protein n=1 Tax=Shewanella abyssi TaxID=311789 RepID=UPI00200F6321|nr:glycine zipper family protein [Shewanella abyssi]MCL1052117.1 glycine zipper family protein [Shewanella abyssi]